MLGKRTRAPVEVLRPEHIQSMTERDSSNGSSQAAKRTAFDGDLIHQMYKISVTEALDAKTKGIYDNYNALVQQFTIKPTSIDPPTSAQLKSQINALNYVVSRLDSSCGDLVESLVRMEWSGRDEPFIEAYTRFLANLVSAHSKYLPLVLNMIVGHFGMIPLSTGRLPGHEAVTRATIHDRAHAALQRVIAVVPTFQRILTDIIARKMPHKSERKAYQVTYMSNVLRVLKYVPRATSEIFHTLIDRVIQIDLEIQIELDDLEEEEGDLLAAEIDGPIENDFIADAQKNMNEEEKVGEEKDIEEDVSDGGSAAAGNVQSIKELVDKLDCVLQLLFEFLEKEFTKETDEVDGLFQILLLCFDSTVLPTFRSRYTQFLLFWSAQRSASFTDAFLGAVMGRCLDHKWPQIIRESATSYVASFVARAKTLSPDSVGTVMTVLCSWLSKYLDDRGHECSSPDTNRFHHFYVIFQATLYIFCFRWKDLQTEDDGDGAARVWLPGLEVISRAIFSKFNPLMVCSPIIVNQFARCANRLGFLYCFSLIQANKRTTVRVGGAFPTSKQGHIESYFPFDPYRLPRSCSYIEPLYAEWQAMESDSDESGSGSESESESMYSGSETMA